MSVVVDVARELFGMFVADLRLAVGVLCLVAVVAVAVDYVQVDPMIGAGMLVVGSLLIVIEATVRKARGR